ncbi:MAG: S41 family peptidase [Candidatus Pacebacteria bacterium]|nr:S41 family peptidase [Candidatus Paceibacterota bacterium]
MADIEKITIKKKENIKPKEILILFLLFVLGFGCGYFFNSTLYNFSWEKEDTGERNILNEALDIIEDDFLYFTPEKENDLIYGAIRGALNSLNDPYSAFFDPKETKEYLDEISGTYEGIGTELGLKDNKIIVISPFKDSPAEKVGLLPGDIILKVNSESINGLPIEKVTQKIKGPKGTKVILEIQRGEEIKNFEIVRDKIEIPVVTFQKLGNDIAYINLYNFNENSPEKFERIIQEILNTNCKKIIVDLRNNPGGYLNSAIDITGYFLKKDDIIVQEKFGDNQIVNRAKKNGPLSDFPVAVLINQGSASASEIFAGSLKENKNALIVGEKSFGKGTVQNFIKLTDGSSIKITVAEWLLPSGKNIEGKGIMPDFQISIDEYPIKEIENDMQVQKAIEILEKNNF